MSKTARQHPLDFSSVRAPDWMVIDAVRYAIGRRTYQVGITSEWLCANWCVLNNYVQSIIRQDVEYEFRIAEETGDYSMLGDECDQIRWADVRNLWLRSPECLIN